MAITFAELLAQIAKDKERAEGALLGTFIIMFQGRTNQSDDSTATKPLLTLFSNQLKQARKSPKIGNGKVTFVYGEYAFEMTGKIGSCDKVMEKIITYLDEIIGSISV